MINEFIQRRFLKKRVILKSAFPIDYRNEQYEFKEITEGLLNEKRSYFEKRITKDRLTLRVNNPDIKGYVVLSKVTNDIAGFQWLLYAFDNEYTHDNYKIPLNKGFLFNAYVDPEHRNKGVFTLLKSEIVKSHYEKTNSYDLLSVVETLNYSSIKVNEKLGSVEVGKNYLFKLWGRNIFVLTYQNNQLRFSLASRKML